MPPIPQEFQMNNGDFNYSTRSSVALSLWFTYMLVSNHVCRCIHLLLFVDHLTYLMNLHFGHEYLLYSSDNRQSSLAHTIIDSIYLFVNWTINSLIWAIFFSLSFFSISKLGCQWIMYAYGGGGGGGWKTILFVLNVYRRHTFGWWIIKWIRWSK